jgi:endonuclease/exonuclease/phosphatase family metal-dependent hydrolase
MNNPAICRAIEAAALVALLACSGDPSIPLTGIAPSAEASYKLGGQNTLQLSALTRNMYIGADADAIIAALVNLPPDEAFDVLTTQIGILQNTDFASRARAIAREIRKGRPHFVGLQEVSKIDITIPPLGVDLHLNFLPTLLSELSALGLNYVVAGSVHNFSVELLDGAISLEDRDALLVDADRASFAPATVIAQTYTNNLGTVAPGVELKRGFVMIDAVVEGVPLKVASTHPEPDIFGIDLSLLRAAQIGELLSFIGGAEQALLMGDLNDVPGSPMYQLLMGGGFLDSWSEMRRYFEGFTCCYEPDLSNAESGAQLERRIDYIFARGLEHRNGKLLGHIDLLGTRPSERIQGPSFRIWPSDHAGLVLKIVQPGH